MVIENSFYELLSLGLIEANPHSLAAGIFQKGLRKNSQRVHHSSHNAFTRRRALAALVLLGAQRNKGGAKQLLHDCLIWTPDLPQAFLSAWTSAFA